MWKLLAAGALFMFGGVVMLLQPDKEIYPKPRWYIRLVGTGALLLGGFVASLAFLLPQK